jgi:hypothetical protein
MPGQQIAALQAPPIGESLCLVHALGWLPEFAQPQSWRARSRPIVWPPARMQERMRSAFRPGASSCSSSSARRRHEIHLCKPSWAAPASRWVAAARRSPLPSPYDH